MSSPQDNMNKDSPPGTCSPKEGKDGSSHHGKASAATTTSAEKDHHSLPLATTHSLPAVRDVQSQSTQELSARNVNSSSTGELSTGSNAVFSSKDTSGHALARFSTNTPPVSPPASPVGMNEKMMPAATTAAASDTVKGSTKQAGIPAPAARDGSSGNNWSPSPPPPRGLSASATRMRSPSSLNPSDDAAATPGFLSLAFSSLNIMKTQRTKHAEFVMYQRSKPYRTVVTEPPATLRAYVSDLLVRSVRRACLAAFLLLISPLLLIIHLVLTVLGRRQRRMWQLYQLAWPHQSVPHVRQVRYPADPKYPLERWHLRCEDGRQRWYYGDALRAAEEGNALGRAQSCGFSSVADYEQQCSYRRVDVVPDIAATKQQQREWLERYQLGLTPENAGSVPCEQRASPEEAARAGLDFLMRLQDPLSGHWPNDYSGCMFLTPGMIYTKFIIGGGNVTRMFPPCKEHAHVRTSLGARIIGNLTGTDLTAEAGKDVPCACGEATRLELIRYLRNYQNVDGGWGQHTEGHSTMLGTALNYTSMRLMGVPADDPQLVAARAWIHGEGGAVSTPMWGKVWLCILGVFSWEGVDPLPPELALMPNWVPFSEGREWCHSRVIAVPFSYLYGLKWSAPTHPVLEALKSELYVQLFDQIKWRECRGRVCRKDLYTPTSGFYKFVMKALDLYECRPIGSLRRYALELNWRQIAYDDENTNFICLGPVNKSLNMLVTWIREGENSTRYQLHRQRVEDYLFMGPTGMRMSGYNGSQLWDTSFAIQATCACDSEMLYPQQMSLAHHYIDVAQVQEDPISADEFFRHRTKGAWNFSTSPQGWQVSDCTAEGLRAILLLPHYSFPSRRVFDAVDEILSLRNINGDGGWASYEPTRAPHYCELFNCAELFKDVMVEYSYAECSSSCIHTLSLFRKKYPDYRRGDVDVAISEGIACVLAKQRPDGSFYGSWAVCFTYAAWLVADAMRVSGEFSDMARHPHCVKLINFLLEHQNADGGWGEDINACVRQVWVDNPDGSQVVNTTWAVMAIMCASGCSRMTSLARRQRVALAVERGIALIMSRQLETGDWAQERISGIFNGNNPIHYPGYKNTMPVWALGMYNRWKREYTTV